MRLSRVALIVGTRPEVIKMAPVHRALDRRLAGGVSLVASGQHRELLAGALDTFGLVPDHHLEVMETGQSPSEVVSRVLVRLPAVLERLRPDALLVQGDTSTTFAAALCGYHLGVPVGHVEAGLRTHALDDPFPEEGNRQMTDRLSTWCFAPTPRAERNLLDEGIPAGRIHITGNTAVDAISWVLRRGPRETRWQGPFVLMTLHRRESFGEPLGEILRGVADFLDRCPEARVVWPVHPNPDVRRAVTGAVADLPRLERIEPLGFGDFVPLLAASRLVLTDSGGLQEEAPSLGKRVLVARDATERPEAVEEGWNRVVGRTREGVCEALLAAWDQTPYQGTLPAPNPYGDGRAGERIAEVLTG